VELNKFAADHDFCLEIKYEEPHQPHVIIEKADSQKGTSHRTYAIISADEMTRDILLITITCNSLQCFDAVGWAAGRASGL